MQIKSYLHTLRLLIGGTQDTVTFIGGAGDYIILDGDFYTSDSNISAANDAVFFAINANLLQRQAA